MVNETIPPGPQSDGNTNKNTTRPEGEAILEMKVPPAHARYCVSGEKKRDVWDKAKLFAEFIGLGFLIAYTIFAGQQVCEMRKANKLTRDLVKDTYAADVTAAMGFDGRRQQVNVGFENRGKHSTIGHSRYEIWLETLDGKRLRTIKSESFDDKIPSVGRAAMPNHYVAIDPLSDTDVQMYKDATEVFKAAGTIRYDDGFGTEVNQPFCVATTAFAYMACDGLDGFIRSLPKKP